MLRMGGNGMKWKHVARRGTSLLLVVMLLISALPCDVLALEPTAELTWTVEGDCLTVSGEIPDFATFNDPDIPWLDVRGGITRLVIEDGVTQIGDYAFHYMPRLTEVSLPDSLKRIGVQSLSAAESLQTLELPASVEQIDEGAFQSNHPNMTLTVYNSACQFGYHPFGFRWDNDLQAEVLEEGTVLRGYLGSTAAAYAEETGVTFSPIGQEGWSEVWDVQMEQVDQEDRKDQYGCVHISTLEELQAIQEDMDGVYCLDNDIHVGGAWTMPAESFTGILDGNGHTISGLTLNGSDAEPELGFFRSLEGTVCDLTFTGVSITSTAENPRLGVIAAGGGGELINCSASGQITATAEGYAIAGGLTGGGGILRDCSSTVTMEIFAGQGALVGGLTGETAVLSGCSASGRINVYQTEGGSGGKFDVSGIAGSVAGAAVDCKTSGELSVQVQTGNVFVAALRNAVNSVNTAQVSALTQSGHASAAGGEQVVACENYGDVTAEVTGGMSGDSAAAAGLNYVAASINHAQVTATAAGGGSAYACGVSGAEKEIQEETGGSSENYGAVSAGSGSGEATAMGVVSVVTGGRNDAAVSASSDSGKSVAYGCSGSSYMEQTGQVSATVRDGDDTSLACGLHSCTDSTSEASVTARQNGTGQALAWGCGSCVRSMTSGSVSAEGFLRAGAVGVNNCTDSSNTGSVSAVSRTSSTEQEPWVSCYGYRGGSGSGSTGTVTAVGNAYFVDTTVSGDTMETLVKYASVEAGNSATVHASVTEFYSVSVTDRPVTVYSWYRTGVGFQGATTEPDYSDTRNQYCEVRTYSPGAQVQPAAPEQPPESEPDPNVTVTGFSLHAAQNGERLSTLALNCGSFSFDLGETEGTRLLDPEATDYSRVWLRISLRNAGMGDSQASSISITLPEGFSFDPSEVVQTEQVTLPAVPAGEDDFAWVCVYPLYTESYQDGNRLSCGYTEADGVERTMEISSCRIYMPQSRFDYAKVYYGVSELDESAMLFKYFNWDASAYVESSDRYQESVMRLSALLSWAVYLIHDDELELADQMLDALGLSCIGIWGESTAMDQERLYAKKTFVVDGQVYELYLTSILGTVDAAGWLGNLAFISKDKYHASFRSVAVQGAADLDDYVETYGSGAQPKYLVTGHSRGGGAANLLGAMLDQRADGFREDVFCYTFAAPNRVREDGELNSATYKNIFNLVNFNDVVGYIPGCYEKYGVCLFYEQELDTVSSLYISQMRQFSTDEFLLGEADGMRMSLMLSFAAPQIDRILSKHLMPYYIEDVWVLDLERDKPISLEEADQRQDDISRRYFDGFVDGSAPLMEFIGILKKAGIKSVKGFIRMTASERRRQAVLRRTLEGAAEYTLDYADDEVTYKPIKEEVGTELLRYGIMQLRCPVDVTIYDAQGNCVAEIKNDALVSAAERVGVFIEKDRKTICLPLDGQQYRLEVSGYADGTMDVQYYGFESGSMAELESYRTIPVQAGETSASVDLAAGSLALTDGAGAALSPQIAAAGEALTTHNVAAVDTQDVYMVGTGAYYHGAYASLSAHYLGEEDLVFAGWYSGDTLLSRDYVLSVQVLEDMTVEARYVPASELPPAITAADRTADGIQVGLQGIQGGEMVTVAAYSMTGRMTDCAVRYAEQDMQSVILPLELPSDGGYIRVFLLDGDSGKPLCSSFSLDAVW